MNGKERYEAAASARRVDFIIKMVLFSAIIAGALVLAVIKMAEPVYLIAALVAAAWSVWSLVRVIRLARPRDLFSKEYEGRVVSVYTNLRGNGATPAIGEIYVLCDNCTSPTLIGAIPSDSAACYQIGDRVLHIKGTICPIILDRAPSVTPCPICAKAHTRHQSTRCPHCGA